MSAWSPVLRVIVAACALHTLPGCTASTDPATVSVSTPMATGTVEVDTACDRCPLKRGDMAGILAAPIMTSRAVPGDAQSCAFLTASFPAITISLRPGLGQTTVAGWMSGKMPLKASPLAGVGDAAVWQASLHEIIAQKHDLLCDIQVTGGAGDIALAADALPATLGALCNRIFAVS